MNISRPGLPEYIGPKAGYFTCIHHDVSVEWSNNILHRVEVIKRDKPAREQGVRLMAMCWVSPDRIPPDYATACQAHVIAEQARDTAWQDYYSAEQARDTAWKAIDTPWQYRDTAWQAYGSAEHIARQARDTAWKAYEAARWAHVIAVQAYQAAQRDANPIFSALATELVGQAWDGNRLVFT